MIPFQSRISYPMIKYIRLSRNLTQERLGQVCKVDQSVLAKLENGSMDLSIHYETKILEGCKSLNISELELQSIRKLLALKQTGGIE